MKFLHKKLNTDPVEAGNIARQLTQDSLTAFTLLFIGSTLWQGLLLHNGLSSTQIGILGGIGSITQAAAMGLNMGAADRLKRPISVMAWGNLPIMLFFAIISLLCFWGQSAFYFPVLVGCVILYYAFYGFRSIFAYKVPYLTLQMEHYGRVTAVSGLVSNLFCIAISVGIPLVLERMDYMTGMFCFYVVCTIFAGLVSYLSSRMRIVGEAPESEHVPLRELLTDKSVTHLAPANFLRGISSGIFLSLTLVASHLFSLDSVALSLLVSLTTLGSVLGNLLYSLFGKAVWLSYLCLGSGILLLILGPASAVIGNLTVFFALFVILQIAYTLVNGTIPVMLARFTPYRIVGGCTSLRLMETMAGTALSSWIAGAVLDHFTGVLPVLILMLVCGASQLYCSIAYHVFYQESMKNS